MNAADVREREQLIQALLSHRLSYSGACACGGRADSANPLDLTRHVAGALIAAGFHYSPPAKYHCCTPGCDPLCDIQEQITA